MEQDEQVEFRTLGWPANLQELALTVDFPNGMMEEISLARLSDLGGLSAQMVAQLQPLFATAFRHLWARTLGTAPITIERRQRLDDFAVGVLSPREAEVVQLILKGHSGLSISLTLKIALPTFHTVTFGGGRARFQILAASLNLYPERTIDTKYHRQKLVRFSVSIVSTK